MYQTGEVKQLRLLLIILGILIISLFQGPLLPIDESNSDRQQTEIINSSSIDDPTNRNEVTNELEINNVEKNDVVNELKSNSVENQISNSQNPVTSSYPVQQLSIIDIYETTDPIVRPRKTISLLVEIDKSGQIEKYKEFGDVIDYPNLPFFKLDTTVDNLKKIDSLTQEDRIRPSFVRNSSSLIFDFKNEIPLSLNNNNYFEELGIASLQNKGLTGKDVTVAIFGDGIQANPEFISGSITTKSFIDFDLDGKVDEFHRTINEYTFSSLVAGLISANGSLKGIAPNSVLIDVIVGVQGYSSISWFTDAVSWTLTQSPDIVILPFIDEFSSDIDLFDSYLKAFWLAGVIPITLGDFDMYDTKPGYQAIGSSNQVIVTAAIDRLGWGSRVSSEIYNLFDFSIPDVFTPMDFVTTANAINIDYISINFLSLGIIAGIIALLVESNPTASPGLIKNAINNGTLYSEKEISYSLVNASSANNVLEMLDFNINYATFEINSEPNSQFSRSLEFGTSSPAIFTTSSSNLPVNVTVELVNENSGLYIINVQGKFSEDASSSVFILKDGQSFKSVQLQFKSNQEQSDLGLEIDAGETFSDSISIYENQKIYGYLGQKDKIDIYSFQSTKSGLYTLISVTPFYNFRISILSLDGNKIDSVPIEYNYYARNSNQMKFSLKNNVNYYIILSYDENSNFKLYSLELKFLSSFEFDVNSFSIVEQALDFGGVSGFEELQLSVVFNESIINGINNVELTLAQYRPNYKQGMYQLSPQWAWRECTYGNYLSIDRNGYYYDNGYCDVEFSINYRGSVFASSNYSGQYIISELKIFTSFGEVVLEDVYTTDFYNYSDFNSEDIKIESIEINQIDANKNELPEFLEIEISVSAPNGDNIGGQLIFVDDQGQEIYNLPFSGFIDVFSFIIFPSDIVSFGGVWIGKFASWSGDLPIYLNISSYFDSFYETLQKVVISHVLNISPTQVVNYITFNFELSEGLKKYSANADLRGLFRIKGLYDLKDQSWTNFNFQEEIRSFTTDISYTLDLANLKNQLENGDEIMLIGETLVQYDQRTTQYFTYLLTIDEGESVIQRNFVINKLIRRNTENSVYPIFDLEIFSSNGDSNLYNFELRYSYSSESYWRSSWQQIFIKPGIDYVTFNLDKVYEISDGKIELEIIDLQIRFDNSYGRISRIPINIKYDYSGLLGLNAENMYEIRQKDTTIGTDENGKINSYVAIFEVELVNSTGLTKFNTAVDIQSSDSNRPLFYDGEFDILFSSINGIATIKVDLLNFYLFDQEILLSPSDFIVVIFYNYLDHNYENYYSQNHKILITPEFEEFSYSSTLSQVDINNLDTYSSLSLNLVEWDGIEFDVSFILKETIPNVLEFRFLLTTEILTDYIVLQAYITDINLGQNNLKAKIRKFSFENIPSQLRNANNLTFSIKLEKVIVTTDNLRFAYNLDISTDSIFNMNQYNTSPIFDVNSYEFTVNDDLDILTLTFDVNIHEEGFFRIEFWISGWDDQGVNLINFYDVQQLDATDLISSSFKLNFEIIVNEILYELGGGYLQLNFQFQIYEEQNDWSWGRGFNDQISLEVLGVGTLPVAGRGGNTDTKEGAKPWFSISVNPIFSILPLLLVPVLLNRKKDKN